MYCRRLSLGSLCDVCLYGRFLDSPEILSHHGLASDDDIHEHLSEMLFNRCHLSVYYSTKICFYQDWESRTAVIFIILVRRWGDSDSHLDGCFED